MLRDRKDSGFYKGLPASILWLNRCVKLYVRLKNAFPQRRKVFPSRLSAVPKLFKPKEKLLCRFFSPNAFFPEEQLDIWLKKLPKQGQIFHLKGSNISYVLIRQISAENIERDEILPSSLVDSHRNPDYFFEVVEYRN